MRLTDEQIASFARGCVCTRREPNGLFLDRMTEPLLAFYSKAEGSDIRAHCPAGARLCFRSDTASLRVAVRYGRKARPVYRIDLRVDGGEARTFGPDAEAESWSGEVFRADSRAMRTFELWMPYVVETWLESVEIDDGAHVKPAPAGGAVWLATGDSITQGMTCSSPARTYPALAARALGVELHNIGVGGGKMHGDVGTGVRPVACAFATAAYGVNDWSGGKPLDIFRSDTNAFLDGLLAGREALPVGLMTPLPVYKLKERNEHGATVEDFREVLRGIASERSNVTLIEGPALLTNAADRFIDGVHPNDLGMAEMGKALAERLRGLMR